MNWNSYSLFLLLLVLQYCSGLESGRNEPEHNATGEKLVSPWPYCDASSHETVPDTDKLVQLSNDAKGALLERESNYFTRQYGNQQFTHEEQVEDVFRLLDIGNHELVLGQKEIVLMVGLTGAGATTLTQFVAGDECQLHANITGGKIWIWDKYDPFSNETIISQTLVPKLTVDKLGVAFYDCAGFQDNRNGSSEIAALFFLKKVVDYADKFKIIVVVRDHDFQDRYSIVYLLSYLTILLPNPEKYEDGISLVSTMASIGGARTERTTLEYYGFLLERLGEELPSIISEPSQLAIAQKLLQIFSASLQGELTRVGLFRAPNRLGCLDEMHEFGCAKANLKNKIRNELSYIEKQDADFGFKLSDNALFLIKPMAAHVDNAIGVLVNNIANQIEREFRQELEQHVNGTGGSPNFVDWLLALSNATFHLPSEDQHVNPISFMDDIISSLMQLGYVEPDEVFNELRQKAEYSAFCESFGQVRPNYFSWVNPLIQLKTKVLLTAFEFAIRCCAGGKILT